MSVRCGEQRQAEALTKPSSSIRVGLKARPGERPVTRAEAFVLTLCIKHHLTSPSLLEINTLRQEASRLIRHLIHPEPSGAGPRDTSLHY